jgi:hypothetical protein
VLHQARGNAKRENLLLLASCCQEGDHKLPRTLREFSRLTLRDEYRKAG